MYMILGLKSNKITTIVDRNFTVFENIRPDIILAEDVHITFLLDRSGSMYYGSTTPNRITKSVEALIFFLRSLPANCKYSILNFGTNFEYLSINYEYILECTEENIQQSIAELLKYPKMSMGGTDILKPLEHLISLANPET